MPRKPLARAVGFVLLTAALLLAALVVAARARVGRYTVLQGLTRNYLEPGGQYQSLRRFREAGTRGHVDLVFLGASHTYRGFDPRLFADAGYQTMNLGSTNQTPLNTYYVAERYLPALSPRVVVLEVSYNTLSTDGLESARDILVNTSRSWSTTRMAFATENLGAIGYATAKGLDLLPDVGTVQQKEIPGEMYVPGGYCETFGQRTSLVTEPAVRFEAKGRQLDYLARISALAGALGARVLWVTLPMPRDYARRVEGRDQLRIVIAAAAARSHAEYCDYSECLPLDPLADFKDVLHLNATGARTFDHAFLEHLATSSYVR